MRQVTGIAKYFFLAQGMLDRRVFLLPPAFIFRMLRFLAGEKLTLLGGRAYVNTHFAPFPSPAFGSALDGFLAMKRGETRPLSVYLSVTDSCPFSCAYCSNHKKKKSSGLSLAELKSLVSQAQEAGAVCLGLTGGEPLVRPDLEEIIASVDARSYTVLFTSGRGLDARRARRLAAAGLTVASVSLDTTDELELDRVRGARGAYRDAVNAVRLFAEAGVYVSVSAVFTGEGVRGDDKLRLVRLAGSLGAHEVRILERIPAGRLAGSGSVRFSQAERRTLEDFRRRVNRDPALPKVASLSRVESDEGFGCGAGRFHVYVDASGRVCPCDFVQEPFGSVKDEPLAAILERMRSRLPDYPYECLNALGFRAPGIERAGNASGGLPGILAFLQKQGGEKSFFLPEVSMRFVIGISFISAVIGLFMGKLGAGFSGAVMGCVSGALVGYFYTVLALSIKNRLARAGLGTLLGVLAGLISGTLTHVPAYLLAIDNKGTYMSLGAAAGMAIGLVFGFICSVILAFVEE